MRDFVKPRKFQHPTRNWNKLALRPVTFAIPMKRTSFLLCASLFLALPIMAQTPADIEKALGEKSYARALELLQKAPETEQTRYQTALALFKTEKWDAAIAAANDALKTANWKARIHYLLGEIYVKAPKGGWKLGEKVWRQDEYPEVKGDQKPVRTSFYAEDQKAALENLETAKIEAQRERDLLMRARFDAPTFGLSRDEERDLNFDLAAFLPQTEFDELLESLKNRKDDFDEKIEISNYSRGWSLPKKVLSLYAEIRALDDDKKADSARSFLAEGLFVRAYLQRMENWANYYDEKTKKTLKKPFPFDQLRPTTPWRNLAAAFPDSPLAPQALLLVAQDFAEKNDLVKARAEFQNLLKKYPKNRLASDARAALAQIERKDISFVISDQTRPGVAPKFSVVSRNVGKIEFVAFKIKLEDFLLQTDKLNNGEVNFTSWTENFGKIEDASKKFGAPVAKWSFKTNDKRDFQEIVGQTVAPFKAIGAFAVVARGENTRFAQLVLISDLAILKKSDRDQSFAFVADAKSGAPIGGANVVLKEIWWESNNKTDFKQGKSDDGGFFDKKRAAPEGGNIEAFAFIGDRYALTSRGGSSWYGNRERNETRVLGTTDRPVYRPNQKVNFRFVVTNRAEGGEWKPLPGRELTVRANNPKGEKFFETTLKTNEFGSLNGEFTIPENAPLGEFSLSVENDQTINGQTLFRVEEYKRPEFEVSIFAPKEAKKPGEIVAARINAKYYFGAPVPNAKVKYTVRKSTWWANYQFPTPYDWLYSSWGVGDYSTGRRNIGGEGSGEIVKEGEVTTDASGFAELSFQTKPVEIADENNWWQRYSNPLYTIEAEVTDQSRRTIEAQGQVKVARQPYFAFLNTKRGYFQKGDRIPIEIRTQDANEQSVAANGKMVVYKLLPLSPEADARKAKNPDNFKILPSEDPNLVGYYAEKILEEPISTDATGRAFWNWEAKESGQYRVEFDGTRDWGEEVKAQSEIWVVGEDLQTIRLRGVTILLDKRSYEEGDVLKAALIADTPGATVLFTQEASGQILRRDVFKIEGKSRQIEIPIERKHVPNFFLSAATVQDFEVYQASAEVFVPPTRQLLKLEVSGDKTTYKPGETGTFQISARDWSDQPARAEVSLALVDASLFYIQKDYTPEIRGFFYGERRYNSIQLDSHRSGNAEARSERDEKQTNYERHRFELPDEMGQLQLMPGGFGYYPYARHNFEQHGNFGGGEMANLTSGSAPMPAMAPAPSKRAKSRLQAGEMESDSAAITLPPNPVQVRSNFAETAFWSPSVITENGRATVKVTFPDSLTQWHASALGLTQNVQVGAAQNDVATKKDLLVRLQAPRFFVEKDQVVISANVHNYSDKPQRVSVVPISSLGLVRLADFNTLNKELSMGEAGTIQLEAGEEKRLDWVTSIKKSGTAQIQITAKTATDSDAVKMTFPVLVHGAPRFNADSGVIRGNGNAKIALNFPKERKLGASRLNVQLNPSLAATMLDALPYLADYPYGCVEQTMSRFLPTAITERTLRESGVNLEQLRARAKAYDAESKTPNVAELVKNTGYSFPKGQPNSRDFGEMASQLWFRGRAKNPIFDAQETRKMVQSGLNRLYEMQRGDGGWGWFPGASESDEYMSAYVVYGLYQAQKAGIDVRDGVLNRGADYLKSQLKDETNIHLLTYLCYALSQSGKTPNEAKNLASGRLFEQRERLTASSKSLLALALFNANEKEKAAILIRNLENTVQTDVQNGTARYKTNADYWNWWNNDVETVAFALRAFLTVEPNHKLVPMLTKWLTLQARGNHFRSTKETAEVVYTLSQYVTQFKELDVDYTLKINLNNKLARTYRVTKDNALFFDNRFVTGDIFLENGANTLSIEKSGKGNLYWSAYSEYFSLEEPIKASGNELFVERKFYKLTRKADAKIEKPADEEISNTGDLDDEVTTTKIIAPPFPTPDEETNQEFSRAQIKDGAAVKSGDLIEVELVVNAKNDYEYLIFEDMKAAGFETVDVRSGYDYNDGLGAYVELRDEKVAFFVTKLPQGRRVLRYRVRAEIPGTFHALPTNGYAMYAPEVRGTSDEMRVSIGD